MSQNAQDTLFREVGLVFHPLTSLDSAYRATTLFNELGYTLPGNGQFPNFPGIVARIEGLVRAIIKVDNATDDEKTDAVAELLLEIIKLTEEVIQLESDISDAVAGFPDFVNNAPLDELPLRLIDFLIVEYTRNYRSRVFALFTILGIFEAEALAEDMAIFQPATNLRKIYWDRLPLLISDPAGLFDEVYEWNTNFNSDKFFTNVDKVLKAFMLPGGLYEQSPSLKAALGNTTDGLKELRFPLLQNSLFPILYSQLGINVTGVEQNGAKKPGFAIVPYLFGTANFEFSLSEKFEMTLDMTGSIDSGLGVIIRPGEIGFLDNLFSAPGDAINFNADFRLGQKEGSGEIILIGSSDGSRFAIEGPGLKIFVSQGDEKDVGFEAKIEALRLVIAGGEGDGFLNTILGDGGITAEAGFTVGYSQKNGFYFVGSGGLEIQLATHITLGPLEIQGLKIALKIKDGNIVTEGGATFKVDMGPLVAVVENIGISTTLSFPNEGGNLGPANLALGFKPPNGVGLSLDAGVVKGGGYLFFDFDREEYAGALELTFQDFLSLKAIGLITTRMPDGSKGFSLLIIITAEFTIQLGYGFVFLGAGGLIGLNRTMRLEPLAEGVRTGATANIMFPTNIVENAPRIISDLRTFFPPEQDKFLIGPMVKLGWGTPTLISISLGIIIEIRTNDGGGIERIAIVGVLKCILPDEEAALLKLQVNFIGAIDFTEKTAFFFASIFESRVLFITIEGEMGVLVKWGDQSDFVVSVGGFHPRFEPPPLPFPVPKRIALSILNESWGKIRVEGYFAVTTNTAQFGAKLELMFGFSEFKIEGHLALDVLFQFNPFFFVVEISGKVSLKVFGFDLFTISLKFSLEGPTPYRAQGYGKLKILFFSFKARFDETWGDSANTKLDPIEVLPLLVKEFESTQNWQAIVPAGNNLSVTLRTLPPPEEGSESIVLHPVGTLKVSQRAVPLDLKLDKVGNQRPSDGNKFDISITSAEFEVKGSLMESFAGGQFEDMDDSKKLSAPAYQQEKGGVEISVPGQQLKSARMTVRHVRYELVTIDTAFKRLKRKFINWIPVFFSFFAAWSAAAKTKKSQAVKHAYVPPKGKVQVKPHEYAVALSKNNTAYSNASVNFSSKSQAEAFIAAEIAKDPTMKNSIHVISNYELNDAA